MNTTCKNYGDNPDDKDDTLEERSELDLLKEAVALANSDIDSFKIGRIQRKLRVGYATAEKLMTTMEDIGIVSAADEFNKRTLLTKKDK